MTFVGVGIDLCEIARVVKLLESEHGQQWIERIFTPAERERISVRFGSDTNQKKLRLATHLAGLYAAKEAIGKATGTGLMGPGRLSWQEIEIDHIDTGAPIAKIVAEPWLGGKVDLSISHDGGLATAIAMLWK